MAETVLLFEGTKKPPIQFGRKKGENMANKSFFGNLGEVLDKDTQETLMTAGIGAGGAILAQNIMATVFSKNYKKPGSKKVVEKPWEQGTISLIQIVIGIAIGYAAKQMGASKKVAVALATGPALLGAFELASSVFQETKPNAGLSLPAIEPYALSQMGMSGLGVPGIESYPRIAPYVQIPYNYALTP